MAVIDHTSVGMEWFPLRGAIYKPMPPIVPSPIQIQNVERNRNDEGLNTIRMLPWEARVL